MRNNFITYFKSDPHIWNSSLLELLYYLQINIEQKFTCIHVCPMYHRCADHFCVNIHTPIRVALSLQSFSAVDWTYFNNSVCYSINNVSLIKGMVSAIA